jgi:hypothetical protein
MAIDFLKMLDPRRGQLGKIDLLDPAVTGTVGFLIGGPAGAAIGAGVGASVKGMEAQQASARLQRQAAQRQIRMQQQQAARERRSAIRQAILARAQARTVAATTGQVAGTGFLGGMASLTSQLGANLGYGTMMSGLGQEYTALSGQAAYLASRSQMAEAIAGLGFGMVGRSGQIGQFVSGLTPAPTPQQTAYPQGQQF